VTEWTGKMEGQQGKNMCQIKKNSRTEKRKRDTDLREKWTDL
jgi:hypothetical protein